MKKSSRFILFLMASIVCYGQSYAQGGFDENIFPYGGFNFWYGSGTDMSNLMNAGDMNVLYNAGPNLVTSFSNGKTVYPNAGVLDKYVGNKDGNWKCSDMRFFLTSIEGNKLNDDQSPNIFAYDLAHSWRSIASTPTNPSNNEWFFGANNVLTGTDYLLKDLDAHPDKLESSQWGDDTYGGYVIDAHSPNFVFDFIFRIDPNEYSGIDDNQTIYQIEYWIKTTSGFGVSPFLTVDIKKKDYNNYILASHLNEEDHILNFPKNIYGNLSGTSMKQYAVKNTVITASQISTGANIVGEIANPPQDVVSAHVVSIDCRVKRFIGDPNSTNYAKGIFIRGLRIRSKDADDLFNNRRNTELTTDFNSIYNSFAPGGDNTAWNKIPAITCGGESSSPSWRALAYIDKKWRNYVTHKGNGTDKRIYSFLADNLATSRFSWYRAIYEDETTDVPPPFMVQCFGNLLTYEDAGYYKHDGTRVSFNTGYPVDLLPTARRNFNVNGMTKFTLFGCAVQNYDTYTKNQQHRDDKLCNGMAEAQAAFPLGRRPGKWTALQSVLIDPRNPDKLYPDNNGNYEFQDQGSHFLKFRNDHGDDYLSLMRSNIKNMFHNGFGHCRPDDSRLVWGFDTLCNLDAVTDGYGDIRPGTAWNIGNPRTFDNSNPPQPNNQGSSQKFRIDTRSPTISEMRAASWTNIAHGAKGILWNTLISDGAENIGIINAENLENFDETKLYDWWDDDLSDGVNNKHPFTWSWFQLGTCAFPLLPENQWDEYRIQWQEKNQNGVWNATGSNYIAQNDSRLTALTSKLETNESEIFKALNGFDHNFTSTGGAPFSVDQKTPVAGTSQWVAEFRQQNCGGTPTWAAALKRSNGSHTPDCDPINDGGALWCCGIYHWPWSWQENFVAWIPTYYGFKERWIGAKTVANDLKPIAKKLSELAWKSFLVVSDLAPVPAEGDAAGEIPSHQEYIDRTTRHTEAVIEIEKFPLKSFIEGTEDHSSRKISGSRNNSKMYDYTSNPTSTNTHFNFSSSAFDSKEESFYTLGLFNHPIDNGALYVTVSNRRTWPIKYTFDGNGNRSGIIHNYTENNVTDELEGAIDARLFQFEINKNAFPNGTNFNWYSVTNLRTGREEIKDVSILGTHFSMELEPGEGTLLRIAPAYGYTAGKTSEKGMAYNNGHRITEITSPSFSSPLRVMTWEKNGLIQYNITNNPSLSGNDNFVKESDVKTLQSSSITFSGSNSEGAHLSATTQLGEYPSIASSYDKVAIIFNLKKPQPTSSSNPSRDVIFAWGVIQEISSNPGVYEIAWKEWKTLDNNVPYDWANGVNRQPNQLVTPVVSPAAFGFFCAWSKSDMNNNNQILTPHYIRPAYVTIGTTATPTILNDYQAENNPLMSIFPTVATRMEAPFGIDLHTGWPDFMERLHLGWEEQWPADGIDTNAHIYYNRIDHSLENNAFTYNTKTERVSKFAPSCRNNHPNIAIQNYLAEDEPEDGIAHGEPVVTWEMRMQANSNDPFPPFAKKDVHVMVRERNWWGGWGQFTALYPKKNNVPLPVIKPVDYATPPLFNAGYPDYSLHYGLVFQDIFANEIHLCRKDFPDWRTGWNPSQLIEQGLFPSIPQAYLSVSPFSFNSITYRGVTKDEEGLYSARIVARKQGTEKPTKNFAWYGFNAQPKPEPSCESGLRYIVRQPIIECNCSDSIKIYMNWLNYDFSIHDSLYYVDTSNKVYIWPRLEDSLRTINASIVSGDSLDIDRIFEIMDTNLIGYNYFSDTSKRLIFEVDLKDSATHQLVQVIDKIEIRRAPFGIRDKNNQPLLISEIDGIPYSRTLKNLIPLIIPPSGKGYFTISIKKDSIIPLELIQTLMIMDSLDAPIVMPNDSSSFKIGYQPTSYPSIGSTFKLSVHPNPFRTKTEVELDAPTDVPLNITVFDVIGRSITTLYNDLSNKEHYSFTLDSKQLSPGMYFVRVQAGSEVVTRKIELVK